ncbi:MAG: hypothetical protein Q9174_001167 [Haloplaca sp. 1 TL-2023]
MRLGAIKIILLLSGCFLRSVEAVYADEAYDVDFHHLLLGRPKPRNTFFYRPSVASKASLLYTLSEQSVLGAIKPKDGSVIWRQQLNNGNGLLRASDGDNALLTAVNGSIQAWDAAEGRQLWRQTLDEDIRALEVAKEPGGGRSVYALSQRGEAKSVIRKISGQSGDVLWEHGDDNLLQASKIKVNTLNSTNGALTTSVTLNADKDAADASSIFLTGSATAYPLLVWSDRTRRDLRFNVPGSSRVLTPRLVSQRGKDIDKIQIHTSARIGNVVPLLVHCQSDELHWAEVYQLDVTSDVLMKMYDLPSLAGPLTYSAAVHGQTAFFIRTTDHDVTLFSSTSDQIQGQWPLQIVNHDRSANGLAIACAISEVNARGPSTFAVRSAIFLYSGDWKMVHNGEQPWFRPESLTGVVAATWAQLDFSHNLAEDLATESHTAIGSAYLHRIRRHAKLLQMLPRRVQSSSHWVFDSFLGRENPTQESNRIGHKFGFHKLIVGATKSGRIFALDVGDHGKILWNIEGSAVEPGQTWHIASIKIDGHVAGIRDLQGGLTRVDVTTGSIIEHGSERVEQSLRTTIEIPDQAGSKLPINVNADGTLGMPSQSRIPPDTIVVTRDEKMGVRGWTLSDSRSSLAWTFVPQPNAGIVSLASRPAVDPIASIGKALGDRNVLYKFLSPNILVIGTVTTDTSLATFYVLDSVSGLILHTSIHPKVDINHPISCVVSENWFAYSLFAQHPNAQADSDAESQPTSGHQLVVSELFESSLPNDRGVLGSIENSSRLRPDTTNGGSPIHRPYVVSQTYLVPAAISFMTVTSTLQGITPRSLLCVVPSLNAIFSIPRALVDPRRPVGRDATSSEAEEGLFRHNAVLEYNPRWALNHMREVMGIQKVIPSPSLLESTSLVFAFGTLDMFGTRVTPIGGFDLLGKGFNKLQLLGTVAALAIGTGLLAPMVSNARPSDSAS